MDIEKLCISSEATILETIKQIDLTGKQILIVIKEKHLVGVVTDGDIRRWILKNGDLQQSVQKIMNRNPVVIKPEQIGIAKQIMKKKSIQAIPVVNKQYIPIDIIFLQEFI